MNKYGVCYGDNKFERASVILVPMTIVCVYSMEAVIALTMSIPYFVAVYGALWRNSTQVGTELERNA